MKTMVVVKLKYTLVVGVLACLLVCMTMTATKKCVGEHGYLRSSSDNNQDEQWKIKRRKLIEKGEWDEDDDIVGAGDLPFHLQDDDLTRIEEDESETYLERYNDGLKEHYVEIEEETKEKEKGIVYSDSAGGKESNTTEEEDQAAKPLRPPPPPPLPSVENATESSVKEPQVVVDIASNKQNNTVGEVKTIHETTNQNHSTSSKHISKHENNKHQHTQSEAKPADTIFDDLLRGFTFAATFCTLITCVYKLCWYTCVKCGIFPDERVMKARWRRYRLKKKRNYGDSNVVPPLDTRKWAEWSAKRGRVNGEIWDSGLEDIENNLGSLDGDDGSASGAIMFDNSGIEMAEWEESNDGNDSGSEILEYGEGDELEDKRHDERLFDADDDGRGVEKEANKFFGNQEQNNSKKLPKLQKPDKSEMDLKPTPLCVKKEELPSISLNASFDALDPPSGEMEHHPMKDNSAANNSSPSTAAKEFLLKAARSDQAVSDMNGDIAQDSSNGQNNGLNNSFVADDRGYDEDADLLGLRSDSPPPLDLEEIEKKLVENMNNAKFY